MIKSSKIIPNTTTGVLKSIFTNESFPNSFDDIPVLLVKKYSTLKDGNMWGRYMDGDREIFIVDEEHIKNLADYLTIKDILSNDGISQIDKDDEIYSRLDKVFDTVKDKLKINSKQELLERYINNTLYFRNLNIYIDSKSLSSELDSICSKLLSQMSKHFRKKTFENNIIDSIYHKFTFKNNSRILSKSSLHSILAKNQYLNFTSDKKFKEFFNQSVEDIKKILNLKNNEEKLKNLGIENKYTIETLNRIFLNTNEKDAWKVLINDILNLDRSLELTLINNNKDELIFSNYATLESTYGIGMPELKTFKVPEYYHGEYITPQIYNNSSEIRYFVTPRYPINSSHAMSFISKDEARRYIDGRDKVISKHSLINLHFLDTDKEGNFISEDSNRRLVYGLTNVNEREILTVLDYNLKKQELYSLDNDFINSRNKSYLSDYLFNDLTSTKGGLLFTSEERENIKKILDTPEKIAIFVVEVSSQRNEKGLISENGKKYLQDVLDKISKAGYKYYYVDQIKGNRTMLIPFKDVNEVQEFQINDRNIPVKRLWNTISTVLSPLINVPINILTAEQIQKEFSNYSDEKAFIKDNQIYINISRASTSDLLHEYAHIVLAYLKNNKNYREGYKNLLQSIWDITSQKEKNKIINLYEFASMEDVMEEVFVTKFGDWVEGKISGKLLPIDNIFRNSKELDDSRKIFDSNNQSKSIKDLFGRTISEVFTNFNENVGFLLSTGESIIDESFKTQFTLSRKQSNWIKQRKENFELDEKNCK